MNPLSIKLHQIILTFGAMLILNCPLIHAQVNFSAPIPNPDGIETADQQYFTRPEFHDLGNDGDGDIFLTYYDTAQGAFSIPAYFQNLGTAGEPEYDSLNVKEIYGLGASYINQFSYGDLNNDGTIDALKLFLTEQSGGEEWEFAYYSNDSEDSLKFNNTFFFNPFQLDLYTAKRFLTFINLVDFDNDEDLDLIISEFTGDVVSPPEFDMLYMQNIGTPDTPQFSMRQDIFLDPSGVPLVLLPTFGDLDEDGDLDMLGINAVNEGILIYTYFENTSTTDVPEFNNALNSPFGLDTVFSDGIVTPALYDYDNDGDLDLFVTSDSDVYPKTNLYLNESVSKVRLANFQKAGLKDLSKSSY